MPIVMRLDRMLAQMGFGTRSQVREMVRAGRVTVDGAALRDAGLQARSPGCFASFFILENIFHDLCRVDGTLPRHLIT